MSISYNHLNLPRLVDFGTNEIEYVYDASATKLQKRVIQGTTSQTDYIGNIVYVDSVISYILTSKGRVLPSGGGFDYEYHLKDHLGNTRVVFDLANSQVNLRQIADYYPFGMVSNLYESSIDNNYLYNGKELQDELGLDWYDYGFRYYDPTLGRWHVPDPLLEKYASLSPYQYVYNNPISFIDPFGLDPGLAPPFTNGLSGVQITYIRSTGTSYTNVTYLDAFIDSYNNLIRGGGIVWSPNNYVERESRKAGMEADQKRYDNALTRRIIEYNQKFENVPKATITANGGDIDWRGVTNASLLMAGGVAEMVVGGAVEFFSAGTSTPLTVPLMIDGATRTVANAQRLNMYLQGNSSIADAYPTSAGALIGKGFDLTDGVSMDQIGPGQAYYGLVNDVAAFSITGGSGRALQSLVLDPSVGSASNYVFVFGGYVNSIIGDVKNSQKP